MNHDYICPVEATLEIVGGKYKKRKTTKSTTKFQI